MKKIQILPALIFSIVLFSCKTEVRESEPIQSSKSAFALTKKQVGMTLNLPAELVPYERAEINAKLQGYVQKVLVDIGDKVRKGQYLAALEAPEIAAQFAEATAKRYEAEAKYIASKDKYNRIRTAAKQQGVVAEAELVNSKHQMMADSAALNSAISTATSFEQLESYLTLRAPFDGVIVSRSIDQGDFVGGADKKPLFVVERPDKLRLRIHVPESYVNSIPAEDALTFTADAVLNRTFTANLARKAGSIDSETRTELWEYEYENQGGELKPGMYVMAQLRLNRPSNSFVAPYSAVVTSMEKKFVIRVRENLAEWVDVKVGISQGNSVEIFGNLREGDVLLTLGSDEIKPGAEVKVNVENLVSSL